jgi:hypothetical protein
MWHSASSFAVLSDYVEALTRNEPLHDICKAKGLFSIQLYY